MSDNNKYVKGPSVEDRDYLAELYYGEDMTVSEIADKIDRNQNTVYRWMRRHDVYGHEGWDE